MIHGRRGPMWLHECQNMAQSAGQQHARGLIDTMLIGNAFIGTRADIIVAAKENFLKYQRI